MFLIKNIRIVNAYELAAVNVSFDRGKMDKHLILCLEKSRFWTFSAVVEHR